MTETKKTTKKTTTKKTSSTPKVEDTPIMNEPVKTPRKYESTDLIECMSCTSGTLIMIGKQTGTKYTWADYGDVCEVEFQDLRSLRLSRSGYIFKPRFLIQDSELVEQWKDVEELYANVLTRPEILALFKLPVATFKSKLKKMPVGMRDAVKTIASEKIMQGSLDSIGIIKAIDEVLGTDLFTLIA